jgi:CheY-like chemotaxis protein
MSASCGAFLVILTQPRVRWERSASGGVCPRQSFVRWDSSWRDRVGALTITEQQPSGRERTILVVEDDRDVRELAVTLLEGTEYRVLEAASADDAYRLLLANPELRIDLLFTDVVMPGTLDGIDLADRARSLQPTLKVLYATGFANLVRDRRDAKLHGRVLNKPYRPSELRRAIGALLSEGRC